MVIDWQIAQRTPQWQSGQNQRLLASMLLSTVFIAALLSLFRMPAVPAWTPVVEIMVRIVNDAPKVEELESPPPVPVVPEPKLESVQSAAEIRPSTGRDSAEEGSPDTNWDAASEQAVQDYVDSQLESYGYVNSDLAEKRRRLSERYQPGTHEPPKKIWENVEKDTLGRTVLRSGSCYKVLDDPNVGSREAFEAFGQFVAVCTWQPRVRRLLPWVPELKEQYGYLRDPDGYVKGEE
jgi:hypothetical protein